MASHEALSEEGRTPTGARARRLALGLTQAEVCRLAGISDVTLWRIETGRGEPQRATLTVLAAVLGCPADELLTIQRLAEEGPEGDRR